MKIDFQPKLFEGLRHYSREKFIADLMAGIIVGIVALPLAIAFGIALLPKKVLSLLSSADSSYRHWEEVRYKSADRPGRLSSSYSVLYKDTGSKDWLSPQLWQAPYWS